MRLKYPREIMALVIIVSGAGAAAGVAVSPGELTSSELDVANANSSIINQQCSESVEKIPIRDVRFNIKSGKTRAIKYQPSDEEALQIVVEAVAGSLPDVRIRTPNEIIVEKSEAMDVNQTIATDGQVHRVVVSNERNEYNAEVTIETMAIIQSADECLGNEN